MKRIIITLCAALLALLAAIGTLFYTGVLWFNMPLKNEYPVRGVDVSNWQGEIDWPTLAAQGIGFAYIKATEGSTFTDAHFAENWQGALDAGVLTGAYHFLSESSTGEAQAAHIIATVPRQDGTLPPVIDIEVGIGMPGINEILDAMIPALEANYGVPPVLYVTQKTYSAFVQGRYEQCPIWVRDIISKPTLPDGREWLLWQYSNRGRLAGYNGDEAYIDLNVFAGSMEELRALCQAEAPRGD